MAVTQHHENEGVSSSLYIQNDPWHPSVSFENFLRNDESIDKQVGERRLCVCVRFVCVCVHS